MGLELVHGKYTESQVSHPDLCALSAVSYIMILELTTIHPWTIGDDKVCPIESIMMNMVRRFRSAHTSFSWENQDSARVGAQAMIRPV